MKFTVLQQDLLPVISSVARSVGIHASLPVLDNLLFATEGSKLKIAATNLEIGVIKFIEVEVIDPGEVTVPAKTIVELVSGLKQSKLEVESDGNNLTISSGKFKATINGIPSTEFPVIPMSDGKGVTFNKEILKSAGKILFASATDEGRPQITGILTQTKGDKLEFVATDGYRLAYAEVKVPGKPTSFKCLIPRKTYEEVLRIISEEEGSEEISISTSENQNQAIFNFGSTIISSRLIEGNFPAWEKIIPASFIATALLDKEDLLKAIKLAAVFTKNEANVVILKTSTGKIAVESSAKEIGSQQNEIEGEISGEELLIAFNAKFLLDAINNAPSDKLEVSFSGALSPTMIKPAGVEGLMYIVMPVKLN